MGKKNAENRKLLSPMLSNRILRFTIVGIFNTVINFIILNFSYYKLGFSQIASNITATSCALVISFLLNRNFVFQHKGHWLKQFFTFAIITAIGTLVINNLIYIVALQIFKGRLSKDIANQFHNIDIKLSSDFIQINVSAVIATIFSMVWNYSGYRLVVFRKLNLNEEIS